MSILTMRTIKCDGIDCSQWIYESDETADILRRMAKREGWKRARIYRDGRSTIVGDFCPDCLGDRDAETAAS